MKVVSKWWATNRTVAEELLEALNGYVAQTADEALIPSSRFEQDLEYKAEGDDGPLWVHFEVRVLTHRELSNGEGHDAHRAMKTFQDMFEGEFIEPELFMQVSVCELYVKDMNMEHFRGADILQARVRNLENMTVAGHNKADSCLDTVGELSMVVEQLRAQLARVVEEVNSLRAIPFNTVQYQQLACGTYAMAKRLGMEDLILPPEYVNIH